jgi:hypothetical protein
MKRTGQIEISPRSKNFYKQPLETLMRMPIVVKEGALVADIIILEAEAVSATRCWSEHLCNPTAVLFQANDSPSQNLIQQWQRAVSPGKQISGQFSSVNPRNSNRPSARMELDILT